LLFGSVRIELKYPADYMISPSLIGEIEVSGFSCWFEGSDDDPCGVRPQI
jgi:hypothetical protein